ncbi:hypothetical protein WISP_121089 [Willisornis vidua]|uniref:Uncharacterized protein n=1 Tax=Willisornis vidua TaxID=1566151 RepID=A0ABQ9CSJ8_9PASS|nr:hypothetical protein WISP_121089 [Willisornis vidua]
MTKSIKMFLELSQVWHYDHFTGDPVPITNYPLGEELFPNVQSELALMQLHLIFSCPIVGQQREELSGTHLTVLLEEVVDHDEVMPQLYFMTH